MALATLITLNRVLITSGIIEYSSIITAFLNPLGPLTILSV